MPAGVGQLEWAEERVAQAAEPQAVRRSAAAAIKGSTTSGSMIGSWMIGNSPSSDPTISDLM